ncbi:MAG TPA: hypothetical protein VK785_05745, partial [Opitutaceae bacterium]|nr:hypothetical protein [Opitutaceae bacterium]
NDLGVKETSHTEQPASLGSAKGVPNPGAGGKEKSSALQPAVHLIQAFGNASAFEWQVDWKVGYPRRQPGKRKNEP